MKKYKIKLKNADKSKIISAKSELEAKVKFCERAGLLYRVFANKLEAQQIK